MRYTPVAVSLILVLLVIASANSRSPMHITPTMACDAKHGDCSFVQRLDPILRNTKSIRAFKFREPCRKCHDAKLTQRDLTDLSPTIPLSAEDVAFFRTKFSDRGSYVLGIQKAMPFFADYGFVLEATEGKATLLLSTYSKSVRLLTDNPNPVLIANIDPLFPELTTWLARLFDQTKGR